MSLKEKLKKWWDYNILDIGKTVYWNNTVDASFTGEYTITTKRNKKGFVGIYNEKKGHRTVPYYYLEPYN